MHLISSRWSSFKKNFLHEQPKAIEYIIKTQEVKRNCTRGTKKTKKTTGLAKLVKPQRKDYGVYKKGKEKKPQMSSKKRVYP